MKLLLIAEKKKELNELSSYLEVVNYYIQTYLIEFGVDFDVVPMLTRKMHSDSELIQYFENLDISGYDCVLALGLRYFTTIPEKCSEILRNIKKTLVAHMYDGGILDGGGADLVLTSKDDSSLYPINAPANRYERYHKYNKYVGWAADRNVFKSRQFPDKLAILLDHTVYDSSQPDRTVDILMKIKDFVKSERWKNLYSCVTIRMIVDSCIVDVDLDNINIKLYDKNPVPYLTLAEELSKTDIFFVTHGESVGLCALEASMSGALVAVPEGFINESLLSDLNCYVFGNRIDWDLLLSKIDSQKSRIMALKYDWNNIVRKMVEVIIMYEK
ncbi:MULTISPECIES: hypothetical protein [unclassified Francisella]|uniref:hypothetical protein n=1 Tax=unclassified Francisella TaxID=2610885 RepID=UPI002E324599|nr:MULTISPECIES: hypothetical protein [unclassified Francisella]MED7820125.1 hypothetical protein [Francisella sp. 19S2-4]MED7830944.1 hypothetical protein [Francisella sp. 19S2-10]